MKIQGNCAKCPFQKSERYCNAVNGRAPEFCSSLLYREAVERSLETFRSSDEIMTFAAQAARQEAVCYGPSPYDPNRSMPLKPRIMEIIEFCQRQGYHKLGLAFCSGLSGEALALVRILESHGFEVVSVVCKVGCTDKGFLGLDKSETIDHGDHESMCNPIAQAMVLNEAGTQFNLMLGLCVGHDSLFFKYADAMTTVVAVKDRLLGHNPLTALYSGYYGFLKR